MRYSSAAYISDGEVTGETPSSSSHWHLLCQDGVFSATAGDCIAVSGNTISVSDYSITTEKLDDESVTVDKVADDLADVIAGKVAFVSPGSLDIDACIENGKLYFGTYSSYTVAVLCVASGYNRSQFMFRADNGVFRVRSCHKSSTTGLWGDWTAWTTIGQVSS